MTIKKTRDYTGYSDESIDEAVQNALQKAGEHSRFEVIETRGSQLNDNKRHYQIMLTTFSD